MAHAPLIVGLGGTTRESSTSERALGVVLARARALGCETIAFGSAQLPIEPYDPARATRSPNARALVDALRRADGVVLVSPSYHGGMSGLLKNAIDFVEDLRDDARVYLQDRAVGCVVCAQGPQAMGSTLASMRATVHALRGWPTPFGAALNTNTPPFGGNGLAPDAAAILACETVADEVVAFARMMRATRSGAATGGS